MSGRRAAILLLIGLLSACGGKKQERTALSTKQDSSTVKPNARSERPIGRSDVMMNGLRPALHEWVAMWSRAIPGFDVDSLWSEGRSAWSISWTPAFTPDRLTEVPWEDSLTAAVFTVQSPDGEFDLEIDDYQAISEDGGEFSVGGEPDSRSMLYDRRRHREAILASSGTMAGQHWGRWVGPDRFLLAGWEETTESNERTQGWISVYSGADSSITTYVTRDVSASEFARYRDAWEEWVKKRYRTLAVRRPS